MQLGPILLLLVFVITVSHAAVKGPLLADLSADEFETLCHMNDEYYQNFCKNRGVCLIRLSKSEFQQFGKHTKLFNKIMRNRAFCSCLEGFTGDRCQSGSMSTNMLTPNSPGFSLNALIAATRKPKLSKQKRLAELNSNASRLLLQASLKAHVRCAKQCNLTCPYGYKTDYRNECHLCECLKLELSECGVPCYPPNTKTCQYPERANSRPTCVCHESYHGSLCEQLKQEYHFFVKIDNVTNMGSLKANEIVSNITEEISRILAIGRNQVRVFDLKAIMNSLLIKFTLYPTKFTDETQFFSMVDTLHNQLKLGNVSLLLNSQQYAVNLECDLTRQSFNFQSTEALPDDQKSLLISMLKTHLADDYNFTEDSIKVLSVKLSPMLDMKFQLVRRAKEPDFCIKCYNLQKDIRTKNFKLSSDRLLSLKSLDFIEQDIISSISENETSFGFSRGLPVMLSEDENSHAQQGYSSLSSSYGADLTLFISIFAIVILSALGLISLVAFIFVKSSDCDCTNRIAPSQASYKH